MAVQGHTARVNGDYLGQHIGEHVRLVGRVQSYDANKAVFDTGSGSMFYHPLSVIRGANLQRPPT